MLFHIIIGITTYGLCNAYFQRRYEIISKENVLDDRLFSLFIALLGPIGFLSCFLWLNGLFFRYGWKL